MGHLIATGHADETHGARGINATFALENCETSAIGRALRNAGYGNDKPSKEEYDPEIPIYEILDENHDVAAIMNFNALKELHESKAA